MNNKRTLMLLMAFGCLTPTFAILGKDQVTSIDADNPNIQYIGRFDHSNPKRAIFDWPGVTIRAKFTGTCCSMQLKDGNNFYTVSIDNNDPFVLKTDAATVYNLATNLPKGIHTIQIQKRTEASVGKGEFLGFKLDKGESLVKPDKAPERRIEFIGDSITCGYGVEAPSANSPFKAETENATLSYAGLVGRGLKADYSLVAYSGRGVVRNYGDPKQTSQEPLPAMYGRICYHNKTAQWDYTSWIPQVVVINLGTNDHSTEPHPEKNVFQGAYKKLIKRVQSQYPHVTVFCVCGPLIGEPCAIRIKEVVDQCKQLHTNKKIHFINVGRILSQDEYGADWHPNIQGQKKVADIVLPVIQKTMNW